jgi:hypothetical protein
MLEHIYREAIYMQHKTAKEAQTWHDEGLLVGLYFLTLVAHYSHITGANLNSSSHCGGSQGPCKEHPLRMQVEYCKFLQGCLSNRTPK